MDIVLLVCRVCVFYFFIEVFKKEFSVRGRLWDCSRYRGRDILKMYIFFCMGWSEYKEVVFIKV